MKISISQTNRQSAGGSSSRFFKSAVLCALAYAFGLYSSSTSSSDNNNRLIVVEDHVNRRASAIEIPEQQSWSANARAMDATHKTQQARKKLLEARKQSKRPQQSDQSSATSFSIPSALNLIPNDQLKLADYFSDSWLLNKKNFLKVPLYQIGIVEDACFAAIGKRRIHDHSKMFVDWTDFMVMHLSKWWGELNILGDEDSTMFDHTTGTIFGGYLHKVFSGKATTKTTTTTTPKSPLHPTIAMIAFAPYRSSHKNRGELLTAHSLASTIASLYHVGFGRVIVTCNGDTDVTRAHEAFRLVQLYSTASTFNEKVTVDTANRILFSSDQAMAVPAQIGNTELAAVRITNTTWFKTKWVKYNMPLAAVIGMQKALGGKLESEKESKYWLGTKHDASYWKYVYLTEPDTLLHTKESMWKPIQEGLDQGLSFFPHRLQPLPHEFNLPPSTEDPSTKHVSRKYQTQYIPNVLPFSNITNLDDTWHCCDDGPEWPGRSEEFGTQQRPCGGLWWWACGYRSSVKVSEQSKEEILEHHKRLVPYPMMTVAKGTGVVFAPTEMGRRCFPSQAPCKRT
ncbi:unnamed protein product [Cylindrotheca closterium]|uniref:Uncharacterized protein n=1 Tax=Cylindrotheca closterium TaxID=2856 RepID=A0AAD2PU85_9STRA|nr:unnamed protein product [Cylindrotheca closterium]